ncbi:hypothetical protein PTKIN_Ptkin11bG0172400 [Pterospermum kingtungense]
MEQQKKTRVGNHKNKEPIRQVKDAPDIDRLSNLPDEVICRIISLLTIKEIVKTSILSKRWRPLYTLISTLNIDDSNESRYYKCNNFMNLVDRVIFSRKSDTGLDNFSLKCGQAVDAFRVNGWIQYALWHGVRELTLKIWQKAFNALPSVVFTCKTLVTLRLELHYGFILRVPMNCRLPSLKLLHVAWFIFSGDDSVRRLISSCLSLEELIVQECQFQYINKFTVCNPALKRLTISSYEDADISKKYEIVINTPSLVYFKYRHSVAKGHSLINLNSLVEACIEFGPGTGSSFSHTAVELMKGISHVQSLQLSGHFSKALLLGNDPIPEFPNITYLKICGFHPGWDRILVYSPFLETLVFNFESASEELESSSNGISDVTEEAPYCLLHHLKSIKILSFHGQQVELQVVERLLKGAKVLENLAIRLKAKKRQQLKISKELLALPRVSMKCQVVII